MGTGFLRHPSITRKIIPNQIKDAELGDDDDVTAQNIEPENVYNVLKRTFGDFYFIFFLPEIHTTGNVKRSVTRDFFFFEFLFFFLLSSVPVSDDSGEKERKRKVIRAAASIFFYLRNFSLGPEAENIKIMMENIILLLLLLVCGRYNRSADEMDLLDNRAPNAELSSAPLAVDTPLPPTTIKFVF